MGFTMHNFQHFYKRSKDAIAIAAISAMSFGSLSHGSTPSGCKHPPKVAGSMKAHKPSAASKRGQALFQANECSACHSINGKGCLEGVALDGIWTRRSEEFLISQLTDPEKHVSSHPEIYQGDPNMMPHPHLTPLEVKLVVAYLLTLPKAQAAHAPPEHQTVAPSKVANPKLEENRKN